MGRPPTIPPEKKIRIVLAILAGEISIAEAARNEKVSEQSIGRWKAEFIEAGRTALVAGRSGPSSREEQLEAEVVELTQALGEAHVELRVWKKSAEGRLGLIGPGAANRPEPAALGSPQGRGLGQRGTGPGRW
jgi:transposase